jgi:vacuolar-type H+-ATPase subunit H
MEVQDKLHQIVRYVEGARSVPMSASAMVNRGELLGLLAELAELIPANLARAEKVLAERTKLLDQATREAAELLEDARRHRDELLAGDEVVLAAKAEADRLLSEARTQANNIRHEAEDYADVRLANVEVVLDRLLTAVRGGREHLAQLAETHGAGHTQWRLPDDTDADQPATS